LLWEPSPGEQIFFDAHKINQSGKQDPVGCIRLRLALEFYEEIG